MKKQQILGLTYSYEEYIQQRAKPRGHAEHVERKRRAQSEPDVTSEQTAEAFTEAEIKRSENALQRTKDLLLFRKFGR